MKLQAIRADWYISASSRLLRMRMKDTSLKDSSIAHPKGLST